MPPSHASVVAKTSLKILVPALHAKFYISKGAEWPSIVFQTDAALTPGQQITWQWSIQWLNFSKQGVVKTSDSFWDAKTVIDNLGGTLTVHATGPTGLKAVTAVQVLGVQPDANNITAYLCGKPNSAGFDKILNHETHLKHFDSMGYPKKSFDGGFGIAQLTTPTPDYAHIWNWKLNIDAGLILFAQKRTMAIAYLSQSGRSYSDNQLLRETVCRWNGGSYHIWDAKAGWVRNPMVLCDSRTGNIGWDTTDPTNKGKSEAELHARDASAYRHAPGADAAWSYFGVCYADAILSA